MKLLSIAVALSALNLYACNAAATTTIVCESCPTTTATPQVVTRTSAPTTSCSGPALTAIYHTSNSTVPAVSTPTPYKGTGNKMAGSVGGALAVALAAVYIL